MRGFKSNKITKSKETQNNNKNECRYISVIVPEPSYVPFSNLDVIADGLLDLGTTDGEVLFDFILCNGNTSDRFFVIDFTNGSFAVETAKNVSIPKSDKVRKETSEYLKRIPKILDSSLLNTFQRMAIRKGAVL